MTENLLFSVAPCIVYPLAWIVMFFACVLGILVCPFGCWVVQGLLFEEEWQNTAQIIHWTHRILNFTLVSLFYLFILVEINCIDNICDNYTIRQNFMLNNDFLLALLVYVTMLYGFGLIYLMQTYFIANYVIAVPNQISDSQVRRTDVELVIRKDWQSIAEFVSFGFAFDVARLDSKMLLSLIQGYVVQQRYKNIIKIEFVCSIINYIYLQSMKLNDKSFRSPTEQDLNINDRNQHDHEDNNLFWLRLLTKIITMYPATMKSTAIEKGFKTYLDQYWIQPSKNGILLLQIAASSDATDEKSVFRVMESVWDEKPMNTYVIQNDIESIKEKLMQIEEHPISLVSNTFLGLFDIDEHQKFISVAVNENNINQTRIYRHLCDLHDSKLNVMSKYKCNIVKDVSSYITMIKQVTQSGIHIIQLFMVIERCFQEMPDIDIKPRKQTTKAFIANKIIESLHEMELLADDDMTTSNLDEMEITILVAHLFYTLQQLTMDDIQDNIQGDIGIINNGNENDNISLCKDLLSNKYQYFLLKNKFTSIQHFKKFQALTILFDKLQLFTNDEYTTHWIQFFKKISPTSFNSTFTGHSIGYIIETFDEKKYPIIPISISSDWFALQLLQKVFALEFTDNRLDRYHILSCWNNFVCNNANFDKSILFELSTFGINKYVAEFPFNKVSNGSPGLAIHDNIPLIHCVSHLFPFEIVEFVWNMLINDVKSRPKLKEMIKFVDSDNQSLFHYIAMRNHYGFDIDEISIKQRERESILVWNFICNSICNENLGDIDELWSHKSGHILVCTVCNVTFIWLYDKKFLIEYR